MPTFPPETLAYLSDLTAHNEKAWFDANRDRYERWYLGVGQAFLEACSARVGMPGKMMRIFRDVRFSKDKSPYKPHLDVWLSRSDGARAEGGWGAGLFARLLPGQFIVGMGCHDFGKENVERYRQAVVSDGDALRAALGDIVPGGRTLKRFPKGYPEDPLMLHTALYVEESGPVPDDAVAKVVEASVRYAPINAWLVRHLS
jgi:uncharacterized protein (TIGR02453 family)